MDVVTSRVVVVTGCGGMGLAISREIGSGCTLVLGDIDRSALSAAADELRSDGFTVVDCPVDVSDAESVANLASAAAAEGPVTSVVHTAGLSPVQTEVARILQVDLLGTAHLLDAFGEVVDAGGAGVFIASMAGTLTKLESSLERRLALTPTDLLLSLPELEELSDAGTAYSLAKRANQLRIQAAAHQWGKRGARVNSISPGVISTKMGQAELQGTSGDVMRQMILLSGTGRIGTPADIAAATEFLLSPRASFITGTDLLVDGGVCAALLADAQTFADGAS